MSQNKLVNDKHKDIEPRLRFSGFDDSWQSKKIHKVFERITRKNKENNQNILTISAQDGLISQEKFFSKLVAAKDVSGYYLLHKNDYAYNKSYSKGYPMGAVKRLIHDEKGVVSTLYICFASKYGNESFFDQYFESGRLNPEIEKIAQEGARNHGLLNMSVGDFFDMNLTIPNTPEQQKIASFLTTVDTRIAKQEQKLSLLKAYKKGVMQKLFTQQIRFKDENGEEYPGWEEKKVGDFLHERKEYASKDGALEHISLTTAGVVPKSERYERDFLVGSEDKKYRVTRFDDICYNPANLKFGVIARNKYKDGIFSPIYITYEVKGADIGFVEYMVTRRDFIQRARRYEQGTVYERMAVGPEDLSKLAIRMPSLGEQQKISELFSVLDDRIESEEAKLTGARKFKKVLLRSMFV